MSRLKRRPGFAIPTAVLTVAIITVALAASFTLISAERRTVDDQQLQVRALGIAQQGIEAYLRHPENPAFRPGRVTHSPPWDLDTAWIPVNPTTGDTAIVVPRMFRVSQTKGNDTLYVISSTGRQGIKTIKGTPPATRTVAELATWSSRGIPIKAGWMSLTGLTKNGSSGTISGNDAASTPCLSTGNVAGVSVPTSPGYSQNGGGSSPLSGSPPLDNSSLGPTPQSAADSMSKAGIGWDRWSQGLDLPNVWRLSDHGGAYPSFADPTYYPVVYVNGDATLPNGQGLLIVSGALTIDGSTKWKGIILVGGTVVANGNDTVEGAVLSGLNTITTTTPIGPASLGNGTKTIQYNSCEVVKALAGTRALVPRRGTWMDNWKTY
jgi:type II secretory pathway pseudopilin PulG